MGNWPKILEHVQLDWLKKHDDCTRNLADGDQVAFNHKGFVAELPEGKSKSPTGQELHVGLQIDANVNPQTKEVEPLKIVLGVGGLLVGMEAAMRQMCEGETLRATIPGPLAYNTKAGFLPYDTVVAY